MLVPLNFKQINTKIKFPVHELLSEDIYSSDGILFVNGKVLDDRNQTGNSLGERRLKTSHEKAKISKSHTSFIDLVKTSHSIFIDSNGVPFRYERTVSSSIENRRIKNKISKGTHTIIYVDKVNSLFHLSSYPKAEEWAQILYLDKFPWLLYSISETKLKEFRKRI